MDSKKRIIIIGGGAAGLLAAIRASELGGSVILIEKMRELGRKILSKYVFVANLLIA